MFSGPISLAQASPELAAKILGFTLIAFAMLLMVLALIGVYENFTGA